MTLWTIGIGLHNYVETHDAFPPGTFSIERLPVNDRFSWYYYLMPYLEGKSEKRVQIDPTKSWTDEGNRPLINGQDVLFLCPSNPNQGRADEPGLTHYIGISGLGPEAAELMTVTTKAGIFGYARTTRIQDIHDGLSHTIAVMETSLDIGPWAAGGRPTVRGLVPEGQAYIGEGEQFGGNHPNGVMVLFADRSVHFVHESIDPKTLEALTTIAGGEKVDDLSAFCEY